MLRELAFSCGQAGAASPAPLYRPTKDNARKQGLAWPRTLTLPSRCQSLCQGPRPPPLLTLNVITPSSRPVASPNFSWKVPSESQKVGFAFLEVCTFRSRWPRPSDCGTSRDLFEMSCLADNLYAKAKLLRWIVLGGQS